MLRLALAATLLVSSISAPLAQSSPPPDPLKLFQERCGAVLHTLRNVRKSEVAAIPDDVRVSVHFLCTGVNINDFGNSPGLGKSIAAKAVLMRALGRWHLTVDNVVGIAIRPEAVDLYVHRF